MLPQIQDGGEKVIAYYSRVLNKAERNYYVTRRQLLAMVESSIRSFHHYLYGWKFFIHTDHASSKWLMSFKNLKGQLARWSFRPTGLKDSSNTILKLVIENARIRMGYLDVLAWENCKYCSRKMQNILRQENFVLRIVLNYRNFPKSEEKSNWRI